MKTEKVSADVYGYTNVVNSAGVVLGMAYRESDARLFAAAPVMLDALREAERVIRWAAQESSGRVKREIVGGWVHHANKARAAISAAGGE